MSTRSTIAVRQQDGSYLAVYCHNDGGLDQPHGVGFKLVSHYSTTELAQSIVEAGNLSALDDTIDASDVYGRKCSRSYVQNRPVEPAGVFPDAETRFRFREDYNYTWTGVEWLVSVGRSPVQRSLAEQISTDSAYLQYQN